VQLLLTNGAEADVKDQKGRTALHLASKNGHETVVQLLLRNGAELGVQDWKGHTALHLAVIAKKAATAMLLLRIALDRNAKV